MPLSFPIMGLDGVGSPPPAAMRAAGYFFALRYVAGTNALGNAEVDAQSAVGNGIGLLFELNPDAALGGAVQGTADGKATAAAARLLFAPEGAGVSFSEDFGPTGSQWSEIEAYWLAAKHVLADAGGWITGGYGAEALVDAAWQAGAIDYAFVSDAWQSPGTKPAGHIVRQQLAQVTFGGTAYDVDHLLTTGCGLWNRDGLWPVAPSPQLDNVVLPVLAVGSSGPYVATLHELLNVKAGGTFARGNIDYGPNTKSAVLKWQAAHKLPVTGVVDAATWSSILSAAVPAETP